MRTKLKGDNSKLFASNTQLEEDANDGYQMLQMVRERERKLKIELKEHKSELQKKDVEIKELFEEKQEFDTKLKLNEKKNEISNKIIKDLQMDNDNLQTNSEEHHASLERKEQVLKNEIAELQHEILDVKKINGEKEKSLRKLKSECVDLEIKLRLVEEENTEVFVTRHAESEEDVKTLTSKSLEEELGVCQLVNKFKCKYCDYRIGSRNDIQDHIVNVHKKEALTKLTNAEQKLRQQTACFTSATHELMRREISSVKKPCYCNGFCAISHQKHNWKKPAGDVFVKKFLNIKNSICLL